MPNPPRPIQLQLLNGNNFLRALRLDEPPKIGIKIGDYFLQVQYSVPEGFKTLLENFLKDIADTFNEYGKNPSTIREGEIYNKFLTEDEKREIDNKINRNNGNVHIFLFNKLEKEDGKISDKSIRRLAQILRNLIYESLYNVHNGGNNFYKENEPIMGKILADAISNANLPMLMLITLYNRRLSFKEKEKDLLEKIGNLLMFNLLKKFYRRTSILREKLESLLYDKEWDKSIYKYNVFKEFYDFLIGISLTISEKDEFEIGDVIGNYYAFLFSYEGREGEKEIISTSSSIMVNVKLYLTKGIIRLSNILKDISDWRSIEENELYKMVVERGYRIPKYLFLRYLHHIREYNDEIFEKVVSIPVEDYERKRRLFYMFLKKLEREGIVQKIGRGRYKVLKRELWYNIDENSKVNVLSVRKDGNKYLVWVVGLMDAYLRAFLLGTYGSNRYFDLTDQRDGTLYSELLKNITDHGFYSKSYLLIDRVLGGDSPLLEYYESERSLVKSDGEFELRLNYRFEGEDNSILKAIFYLWTLKMGKERKENIGNEEGSIEFPLEGISVFITS